MDSLAHHGRCSPVWQGSRYLLMLLQVPWSLLHCGEETPRPGHPYERQPLTQLASSFRGLAHYQHGREHGGTQAGTGEVTESYILICRRVGVGERGTDRDSGPSTAFETSNPPPVTTYFSSKVAPPNTPHSFQQYHSLVTQNLRR